MEACARARKRLVELEDRVPWSAVKKSWGHRRADWVKQIEETLEASSISRLLLMLESALKLETFTSAWNINRDPWKVRVEQAVHNVSQLEEVVVELELAIQWDRILMGAAGQSSQQPSVGVLPSVPMPPPLGEMDPDALPEPPVGVPRLALKIILLLRAMGVRDYEPSVVAMLLELVHSYTSVVLKDALFYSRMRQLRRRGPTGASLLASDLTTVGSSHLSLEEEEEGAVHLLRCTQQVEIQDAKLAVQGRMSHMWMPPPSREVIAQLAADVNNEPMPLLPR
ncbi:MAG: hypothetical protein SGPRY_013788, partial [Prymnesium sp.]